MVNLVTLVTQLFKKKSSLFCPEDVDTLSNLIKAFGYYLLFCILIRVRLFEINSVFGTLISGDWRQRIPPEGATHI